MRNVGFGCICKTKAGRRVFFLVQVRETDSCRENYEHPHVRLPTRMEPSHPLHPSLSMSGGHPPRQRQRSSSEFSEPDFLAYTARRGTGQPLGLQDDVDCDCRMPCTEYRKLLMGQRHSGRMMVPGSAHPWSTRKSIACLFPAACDPMREMSDTAHSRGWQPGTSGESGCRQSRHSAPAAPAGFGGSATGPEDVIGGMGLGRGCLPELSSTFIRTPPCQLPRASQPSTTNE